MTNAIQAIMPYQWAGTWVFDDPHVGLVKEPFVLGIPEMIDVMVADIPNAEDGFRLNFSVTRPPTLEDTHHLKLMAQEGGGGWYRDVETRMCGWLCPAMLHYFPFFVAELFIWADGMVTSAQIATHNMHATLIGEMELREMDLKPDRAVVMIERDDLRAYLDEYGIPAAEDKR